MNESNDSQRDNKTLHKHPRPATDHFPERYMQSTVDNATPEERNIIAETLGLDEIEDGEIVECQDEGIDVRKDPIFKKYRLSHISTPHECICELKRIFQQTQPDSYNAAPKPNINAAPKPNNNNAAPKPNDNNAAVKSNTKSKIHQKGYTEELHSKEKRVDS